MSMKIDTYSSRLRLLLVLILCAATFALMANDARAQQQASVAGTYCGTWASRNYWKITLRQTGADVGASLTGHNPEGRAFTGTGNGAVSGSQISVQVTMSRDGRPIASGTFTGTLSGRRISAAFSRVGGGGDSASFNRC